MYQESVRARGRPKHQLTPCRSRVCDELEECKSKGERITLTELAKRCRLHSYRDAKRIVRDLVTMGLLGL